MGTSQRAFQHNVLPERVFELYFDSQVAVQWVFTLHAHLEHAGVTAACREGEDRKDLQVRRRKDAMHMVKKNLHTSTLSLSYTYTHTHRLDKSDYFYLVVSPPNPIGWKYPTINLTEALYHLSPNTTS